MIKIVQGNDINLHIPLVEKDGRGAITAIDATQLTDLSVRLFKGSTAFADFTTYTVNNTVVICLNETAPEGIFSILITAKNNGVDICYNEKCAFSIVRYNDDSTYLDYIADEDITLDSALFVAAKVDDAQVQELREELQAKIAETEASKAAYDQAADNLIDLAEDLGGISETVENAVEDAMQGADVAKQGTDPTVTLTIIKGLLDNLDLTNVAKQGTDPTATLTAIKSALDNMDISNVAKQGANTSATLSDTQGAVKNGTTTALAELLNNTYGLAALQTLVSAITGYALQGSDTTATNTAIKNAIANIDLSAVAKQGSDATATLTAVASAIATLATAVSAIPTTTPATPTDVSNAQTAIIGAMPSVSGLASETSVKDGNDTAISLLKDGSVGLAAIKALVQAISGYALQGSDPTATNTAILSAILSNAGTPQLTIPNSTASQELAPNTVYLFESRTNNLTLTLGTPIAGQNNEYHFFVFVGATAPSITYPSGISWNGGSAPTIVANKNYEISINNNIAAYFEI